MIRWITGLILLGISGGFFWLYHAQYFRWRGCFNDLGRCFDPVSGMVYLEQAGMIWLSLGVVTGFAALWLLWRASHKGRGR